MPNAPTKSPLVLNRKRAQEFGTWVGIRAALIGWIPGLILVGIYESARGRADNQDTVTGFILYGVGVLVVAIIIARKKWQAENYELRASSGATIVASGAWATITTTAIVVGMVLWMLMYMAFFVAMCFIPFLFLL